MMCTSKRLKCTLCLDARITAANVVHRHAAWQCRPCAEERDPRTRLGCTAPPLPLSTEKHYRSKDWNSEETYANVRPVPCAVQEKVDDLPSDGKMSAGQIVDDPCFLEQFASGREAGGTHQYPRSKKAPCFTAHVTEKDVCRINRQRA